MRGDLIAAASKDEIRLVSERSIIKLLGDETCIAFYRTAVKTRRAMLKY